MRRIAVGVYGCWRTGNICFPWLARYFSRLENCSVDFIFNLKDFNNTETLTVDEKKQIENFIHHTLVDEGVVGEVHIDWNTDRGASGDFILQRNIITLCEKKSLLEHHKDIVYDMVYIIRPDIIISPIRWGRRFEEWITEDFVYKKIPELTLWVNPMVPTTLLPDEHRNYPTWAREWNDFPLIASSLTCDLLASHMAKRIMWKKENQNNNGSLNDNIFFDKPMDFSNVENGIHHMLKWIGDRTEINIRSFPRIHTWESSDQHLISKIIRDHSNLNTLSLEVDDLEFFKFTTTNLKGKS